MNTRTVIACALMLAVAGTCAAQPGETIAPPQTPGVAIPAGEAPATLARDLVPPPTPTHHNASKGLSSWITYTHPDCCGPLGSHGLIQTELFARVGASMPLGGAILQDRLDTGWLFQGGGRTLIFDADELRAWTFDIGITNIWNNGQGNQVPFVETGVAVTVRDMNRTYVNAGFGREYYLLGSARSCDSHLRVGWDVGGHYGTARLGLNDRNRFPGNFRRVTSWEWGPYVALHADAEIQYGAVTFINGLRLEWNENFINRLLAGFDNDLNNLNLVFNFGVRY